MNKPDQEPLNYCLWFMDLKDEYYKETGLRAIARIKGYEQEFTRWVLKRLYKQGSK